MIQDSRAVAVLICRWKNEDQQAVDNQDILGTELIYIGSAKIMEFPK